MVKKRRPPMTYRINSTPVFADAVIIVEQPHLGRARVWFAFSEQDAIECTAAAAERYETSDYDLTTFDGAMAWNSHDLRNHQVIRAADIAQHVKLDDDRSPSQIRDTVMEAAIALEWIAEVADEDHEDGKINPGGASPPVFLRI